MKWVSLLSSIMYSGASVYWGYNSLVNDGKVFGTVMIAWGGALLAFEAFRFAVHDTIAKLEKYDFVEKEGPIKHRQFPH